MDGVISSHKNGFSMNLSSEHTPVVMATSTCIYPSSCIQTFCIVFAFTWLGIEMAKWMI